VSARRRSARARWLRSAVVALQRAGWARRTRQRRPSARRSEVARADRFASQMDPSRRCAIGLPASCRAELPIHLAPLDESARSSPPARLAWLDRPGGGNVQQRALVDSEARRSETCRAGLGDPPLRASDRRVARCARSARATSRVARCSGAKAGARRARAGRRPEVADLVCAGESAARCSRRSRARRRRPVPRSRGDPRHAAAGATSRSKPIRLSRGTRCDRAP
jgi:hypothetical protein